MIEKILKQRDKIVEDVKNKKDLHKYFLVGNLIVTMCSAIYGIGLGFFVGGIWVLFDAIKMPLILLLTLYISLPVFYIVDVYSGGKIDFFQEAVLLIIAFSVIAINLSAFMPVALLFSLTTTNVHFIVLLSTCIYGFAGLCGLFYLFRCFQTYYTNKNWYPAMFIGSFVVVFVGT
ncbi:MAG: hypothetical protein AB1485_02205 [Candidatus Thermoplasmatota archaeon]